VSKLYRLTDLSLTRTHTHARAHTHTQCVGVCVLKSSCGMVWYAVLIHFGDFISVQRPPLWSDSQGSWLQIQRSGFDSWCYQIFWEVVSLDQDTLSLVSTTEELLGRKLSSSSLEIREYGCRDLSRWPLGTLYSPNVGTNFADKRLSLGRYSLLMNSGHGVFFSWELWIMPRVF
jgi:hypothetical protein